MSGALVVPPNGSAVNTQNTTYDIVSVGANGELSLSYEYSYGFLVGPTLYDTGALVNAGLVDIEDSTALTVGGDIDNTGIISIDSSPVANEQGGNADTPVTTSLFISGATVTLDGGGQIVMSDESTNIIYGGTTGGLNTLVNVDNTISGAGEIGTYNGTTQLALTNEAAGTIDADASAGIVFTGYDTAITVVTNAGLMEATGAGSLVLSDSVIDNTGTVLAAGAGAVVGVENNGTIVGGLLETTGGGLIEALADGNAQQTLDGIGGVTITAGSTVQVNDGAQLNLLGTIINDGTIGLASTGDGTLLIIESPVVTLEGGGDVLLSASTGNIIEGPQNGGTDVQSLINVNNTISGAGRITAGNGDFAVAVTNEAAGVIDASSTVALTLQLLTVPLVNTGLIEATGSGGLTIQSTTIDNSVSGGGIIVAAVRPELRVGNTLGTILASGAGDNVVLTNAADIVGGLLETTGGGLIEAASDGNAQQTLDGTDGLTITAGSTVQVNDNATVNVLGTIANAGTLSLASTGDGTLLIIDSPVVTLDGGGDVLLSDNANNVIEGNQNDGVDYPSLVNVDNTISGAGQITVGNGDEAVAVTNEAAGIIDADLGTGLTLALGAVPLVNAGLIEATASGGLLVDSTRIDGSSGGTILASGSGDNVGVIYGGDLAGGTLETSGGGLIDFLADGNAQQTLDGTDGLTITAGSTVQVNDNATVNVLGTIANAGTLSLASTGDGTDLFISSPTLTLTGDGTIVLSGTGDAYINPASGESTTLVNMGNTIVGAGQIGTGYGTLTLDNAAGTIESSGGLTIGSAVTGDGTLRIDADQFLVLQASVAAGQIVIFGGAGAALGIDQPFAFAATLADLAAGDTLSLNVNVNSATIVGDALEMSTSNGSLTYAVSDAETNLSAVADGSGTVQFDIVPCFLRGTRIATPAGETAVEDLRVGDLVSLAAGGARPIRWIGTREIDVRRHRDPAKCWPIRIEADAFAPGAPHSTIWLSPDHAVFIDGVLIPVRFLVNDATIRHEPREAVSYWHVELDRHDVVLACGLPAESYLDTGNRCAFANGGASLLLHPDFAPPAGDAWTEHACAPAVWGGPMVDAACDRLAGRAAALARATALPQIALPAGGIWRRAVPADATTVRLVSPSGYHGTDVRRLGALIRGLSIDGAPMDLDDVRFGPGFHTLECHDGRAVRWTDGTAVLAIARGGAERTIEVDVAAVMTADIEARCRVECA